MLVTVLQLYSFREFGSLDVWAEEGAAGGDGGNISNVQVLDGSSRLADKHILLIGILN